MGHLVPVLLALVLNSSDRFIFTNPKNYNCLPYLSFFIFLLAVFFLLWDVKLKPTNFRKLYGWAEFAIEFAVNMMIMELIMYNFWFPLEMAFLAVLAKIPDYMERFMATLGYKCTGLCQIFEILKWQGTLYLASHLLSLFFLFCILHATRIVDFRILRKCGGGAFVEDTTQRGREFYERVITTCNSDCMKKASHAPCPYNRINRDPKSSYNYVAKDSDKYCNCDYGIYS